MLVTAPGGGGRVVRGDLGGFADETAFSAIARILEANPEATGRITLYTDAAGRAIAAPLVKYITPAKDRYRDQYTVSPVSQCLVLSLMRLAWRSRLCDVFSRCYLILMAHTPYPRARFRYIIPTARECPKRVHSYTHVTRIR